MKIDARGRAMITNEQTTTTALLTLGNQYKDGVQMFPVENKRTTVRRAERERELETNTHTHTW